MLAYGIPPEFRGGVCSQPNRKTELQSRGISPAVPSRVNPLIFFIYFFCISLTADGLQLASLSSSLLQRFHPVVGGRYGRMFPFLPCSCQRFLYRDASSALFYVANQLWPSYTYSCSHTFRYGKQNKKTP